MFGILAFGDSITYGRGEQPMQGWVGRLKNDFEAQDKYNGVYNLGIPGDTSTELLKRIEIELTSRARYKRPEDTYTVLIAIGTNDAKSVGTPEGHKTPPDVFEKQVTKIVSIAKEHAQTVVLIGLTPVDEARTNPYEQTYLTNKKQQKYDAILQKVSEEQSLLFIDVYTPFSDQNYPELLDDGLHPNTKGYDLLYDIINEELKKKGAL